jgi:hypothetical protein
VGITSNTLYKCTATFRTHCTFNMIGSLRCTPNSTALINMHIHIPTKKWYIQSRKGTLHWLRKYFWCSRFRTYCKYICLIQVQLDVRKHVHPPSESNMNINPMGMGWLLRLEAADAEATANHRINNSTKLSCKSENLDCSIIIINWRFSLKCVWKPNNRVRSRL